MICFLGSLIGTMVGMGLLIVLAGYRVKTMLA